MVASAGHVALIVPAFARGPVWRHRLGVYRYEGRPSMDQFQRLERSPHPQDRNDYLDDPAHVRHQV